MDRPYVEILEQPKANSLRYRGPKTQSEIRGRILGQNPDKSPKSLPPRYSVTSIALPWDFYFFELSPPLTISVKEKEGKYDRKPYHTETSSLRTLKSMPCPETSMKLYVHEFGF
jgi:hypothetical protein